MKNTMIVPCCMNCWRFGDCPDEKANGFCARFQSSRPQRDEREDPNRKWEAGEDADV